jgi:hypothetical protein
MVVYGKEQLKNLSGVKIVHKCQSFNILMQYHPHQQRRFLRGKIRATIPIRIAGGRVSLISLSEMPRFEAPKIQLPEYIGPAFIDTGLLVIVGMMVFAGAFAAFLRYDVR